MAGEQEQAFETRLVHAARQGPEGAFSQLVERYYSSIYSYLMRQCANPQLAEDLAQETMVNAYQSIENLKEPERFSSWLFAIARNELYSVFRRRRLREFISLDRLLARIADHVPRPLRESDQTDRYAERDVVRRALAELPQTLREPLVLSQGCGFTGPEIAQLLDISEVAVRQRIHRANARGRGSLTAAAAAAS
jgi:RNA polymerase sigma factor (sigma-70 family)